VCRAATPTSVPCTGAPAQRPGGRLKSVGKHLLSDRLVLHVYVAAAPHEDVDGNPCRSGRPSVNSAAGVFRTCSSVTCASHPIRIATAIIDDNSAILSRLLTRDEVRGHPKALALITPIAPAAWRHILLHGYDTFHSDGRVIDLDAIVAGLDLG